MRIWIEERRKEGLPVFYLLRDGIEIGYWLSLEYASTRMTEEIRKQSSLITELEASIEKP